MSDLLFFVWMVGGVFTLGSQSGYLASFGKEHGIFTLIVAILFVQVIAWPYILGMAWGEK